MLEINSAPNRRDLNDVHARAAHDAGVRILVNSDSHGVGTLSNVRWGIATARRAWLTREDVANTLPWAGSRRCASAPRWHLSPPRPSRPHSRAPTSSSLQREAEQLDGR